MDVVGLYPSISHGEGLASLDKVLEAGDNKQISSEKSCQNSLKEYYV